MSNSTPTSTDHVPEDMLLSVSNVQTWDVYILEHLIGYSHLGRAISTNSKYILLEPQQNDLIAGTHTRIYRARPAPRDNELQPSALTAFRDDLSRYHKLNDNRLQDESKLCAFLMKSFSVEAKMTLRNNAAFKVAVAKTDSYEMYEIAKSTFSCSTSFGVASHQFKQLFQIKQTGTFTQYKDTMLQHNNCTDKT